MATDQLAARDSAAPKTACECTAQKALEEIREARPKWTEGGSYSGGETWCGFAGRLQKIAGRAIPTQCPCEALRETVDSMLRCVGKNAANVDDPVAAIKITYRALVETRAERDQLRAQVEEHQRWLAADSQHAENQHLRAELENAKHVKHKALEFGKRMEEERDRLIAKNEELLKELVALRVRDSQRREAIHRMLELADARDIDDSSAIRKLENERETLRAELARRNAPDPHGPLPCITNSTGRVRFCEDCGARLNPGVPHYCPGPEESR